MYRYFCLLILLGCFLQSCQKDNPVAAVTPIEVLVETVRPQTIPANFEYIGVIQSSHEVEIRARVTGYLDTIAYQEGGFVQKGDLLFQLDPRPFQAALAKSQAQLAREKAVLWQSQRAVKRFTPLYEQKAASQRDLDNSVASEMSAEAQVMEAQAQVMDAEVNLSYTTILSPVNGLTSQAKYRVGSLISPSQDLLTTVSVIDPIWVNFSISEQDILASEDNVRRGKLVFPPRDEFEIELILADQTVFPQKGIVNFASPSYNQQTGTLLVRAVLPNPDKLLRPGQFVRVKVHGATWSDVFVIPQQAVMQGQKETFVFIVNVENRVEVLPIEPGPWDQKNWLIWKGLKAGDKVIVNGVNKVSAGALVTVKEEHPDVVDKKTGKING